MLMNKFGRKDTRNFYPSSCQKNPEVDGSQLRLVSSKGRSRKFGGHNWSLVSTGGRPHRVCLGKKYIEIIGQALSNRLIYIITILQVLLLVQQDALLFLSSQNTKILMILDDFSNFHIAFSAQSLDWTIFDNLSNQGVWQKWKNLKNR